MIGNIPDEQEYDDFMKAILHDTDKELLVEFIEWYAMHYGYLINKENVELFLKDKK
jgi:hypothetical protein